MAQEYVSRPRGGVGAGEVSRKVWGRPKIGQVLTKLDRIGGAIVQLDITRKNIEQQIDDLLLERSSLRNQLAWLRVSQKERDQTILRLKIEGWSQKAIAEHLDSSQATISRVINKEVNHGRTV